MQSIGQNPLTEAAAGLSPLKYGNGFSISDPSGPMSAVSLSSMLESHIFSVVWLALALLLLLRKLYLYGQAASAIRSQSKGGCRRSVTHCAAKVKAAMGIKRSITVCTNSFIKAPLLTGLVRPTMVLPAQVYSNTELEYIFMHELTHYRRGDLFYKWLVEITLCLHWFNPMVYWIRKQVSRHCELSCDEAVISRFDSHRRKSYGNVLLDAAGSDIESKEIDWRFPSMRMESCLQKDCAQSVTTSRRPSLSVFDPDPDCGSALCRHSCRYGHRLFLKREWTKRSPCSPLLLPQRR